MNNYKLTLIIIIIIIILFFIRKLFNKTEKYQTPSTTNKTPNTTNKTTSTNNPEVTCETVEDCEEKLTKLCGPIKDVPNIEYHTEWDKLCWINKFKTDRPAFLVSKFMIESKKCSTLILHLEKNVELLNKIKEKNPCTKEVGGTTSSTSLPPTIASTAIVDAFVHKKWKGWGDRAIKGAHHKIFKTCSGDDCINGSKFYGEEYRDLKKEDIPNLANYKPEFRDSKFKFIDYYLKVKYNTETNQIVPK